MSESKTLSHQNPITIINYINVGIKKGRSKRNVDVGKQNAKIGRKRKHDQSREEKRDNKYSNISYINSKDEQVLPKVFEDFNCNCKLKCPENISAAERLLEFEKFHSLGTYTNQNLYLLERVEENFKKRCYTRNKESKTQRTFSRIYHIKDVRVCKEMFVKTFKISPGRVSTVLNKVRKGDGLIDRRGTANGGHNRTSDELVTEVFNHIQYVLKTKGLPTKRTKRRKQQPERNTIKSMYDMYKKDKLTPGIVSFSTYKAMYYKHLKSSDFLENFDDEPNSKYLKPGDRLASSNDGPKVKYLKPGDCLPIFIDGPKHKSLKAGDCLERFNDESEPTVVNNIVPDKKIMPTFSALEHQSFCSCGNYDDVKNVPIIQFHGSIGETNIEKSNESEDSKQFHDVFVSESNLEKSNESEGSKQFHVVFVSESNLEKSNESEDSKQFDDVFVSEINLKNSNESECPSEPVMLETPQHCENVIPQFEIIYEVKIESPSIQELKVTKCKRKVRGKKVGVQTREERKNNKYSNTEYLNTKNEKVLPKIFKEFDCHCNNKCAENITIEEQSKLFEQFHNLGSYSAQNLFLLERVEEIHKKRCYTKNKQKQERTYTRIYTFNNIKVCKAFFVKTLQISPSRVNTVLTKVRDGQGLSDQRGIAIGGHNRISHESRIEVIHHISTIITSTSPNWMDTKVGCPFPPEYTFKKMYDMYKGSYQSEVVSFSTYKAIFYKEFGRPTMDWQFT